MLFRPATVIVMAALWSAGLAILQAQPAERPEGAVSEARPALPGTPRPGSNPAATSPPRLPGSKSPAETLRELLAMSPAERAQALANKTERQRKYLETRLREYEAMPKDQREARLRQLDLTFHLDGLMGLEPSERVNRLAMVPPALRPVIEERLREWDRLPESMQSAVLRYETTANYFVRARPAQAGQAPEGDAGRSFLPGETRGKAAETFIQFFGLSAKEQQRTLEVLPQEEREKMEKALSAFASLPPEQRRICIESFVKFKQMSKEEVNQFLKNAARWKAMSPQERETWRSLISILPPHASAPGVPPSPPGADAIPGGSPSTEVPAQPATPP